MAQAGTTAATAPKLPSCSLTYPIVELSPVVLSFHSLPFKPNR